MRKLRADASSEAFGSLYCNMMRPSPIARTAMWLLFLAAAYFPLFLHLDTLTIRVWDESLYACNALEMSMR